MANGRFPEGVSGNPGGRPKALVAVVELARKHSAAAIKALVDIMEAGESEQARIAAATALLNRAWGKPAQRMEHEGSGQVPVSFTVNVWDKLLGDDAARAALDAVAQRMEALATDGLPALSPVQRHDEPRR